MTALPAASLVDLAVALIATARERLAHPSPRQRRILLALLVAVFVLGTWPLESMLPTSGLDPSWEAGVAMAFHLHLHWGPSLDFAYGPLGFLVPGSSLGAGSATALPLYYASTAALAIAYALVLHAVVFALLLHVTRSWGALASAVASFLVGATVLTLVTPSDLLLAPGLLLGLLAIRADDRAPRRWLLGALGLAAAVGLLVKLEDGLLVLGVGLVAALVRRPREIPADAGVLLAAFAATVVAAWLATGNRIGDLPTFLRYYVSLASGYTAAMQGTFGRSGDWLLVALELAVLLGVAIAALRPTGRRESYATALVLAGVGWGVFKEGFVRQDTGHDVIFFTTIGVLATAMAARSALSRWVGLSCVVAVVAICWIAATNPPARSTVVPSLWVFAFAYGEVEAAMAGDRQAYVAVAIVAVGVVGLVLWLTLRRRREGLLLAGGAALLAVVWGYYNSAALGTLIPAGGIENFVSQLRTVASPANTRTLVASARQALQDEYDLPRSVLSDLQDGTTAVEPWENTVAWAYPQIRWRPEPVLQSYAAFTSSLDELDASFLASGDAPDRILEAPPVAIDGRVPAFDPPATQVAVMCNYAQELVANGWQVLRHVTDRCGPAAALGTVRASYGASVAVPAAPAGEAVLATFSIPLPLTYRLLDLVFKPPDVMFVDASGSHRFVVDDAADLHVMRPPTTLGWSAPFTPPSIGSFSLTSAGPGAPAGTFTVSFYAMRMSGAS